MESDPKAKKDNRSSLRRFMGYVWPYFGLLLASTFLGLLKFILPASMAISLRFLTDRLAASTSANPAESDFTFRWTESYLHWLTTQLPPEWHLSSPWNQFNLLMLTLTIIYLIWGLSSYYRSYLESLARHRIMLNLRTDLYQHITRMGHSFFQKRQSGAIVARLMNDIALAQNFIGSAMTAIWMDLGASIFYVAVLFSMDKSLAIASLIVFPFHIACMRTFGRASKKASKDVQEAMEEFSGDVQERIAGISVVKSFAAEQRETQSFFSGARNLYDLTMRSAQITSLSDTLIQWLTQIATLGLVWYGGYRIFKNQISVGTVIAFILLLQEMYTPITRISNMNTVLHNSLAAIDRIFEIFDIEPDVQEKPKAICIPRLKGHIQFENITFSYEQGRARLLNLHLEIQPGETVALVGPSGAGKSTLIQLIPRFYDPQNGCILIDHTDVREMHLRSLRSQIGMVAQDTILFSGTVRDNLLYGRPDATDEEILKAAKAAHAHEFLNELEEGYETILGERGAKLSGGQKQRIAIARAFLCDPRILILDEATSALDSESELLIQEALSHLMKNRTSIVIAHRLSTIINSNRIVVMNQGQIVEVGPHLELLGKGGLYSHLYETQFRFAESGL